MSDQDYEWAIELQEELISVKNAIGDFLDAFDEWEPNSHRIGYNEQQANDALECTLTRLREIARYESPRSV